MAGWQMRSPGTQVLDQPPQRVRVRLLQGSVAVLASTDSTGVQVTAISHGTLRATETNGGTLAITDGAPSRPWLWALRRRWLPAADIAITVPVSCSVDVTVIDAAVTIAGLRGAVKVHNVAGTTTVSRVEGDTEIRSTIGAVRVDEQSGNLDVHSVTGRVVMSRCLGAKIQATSTSGDLTADVEIAGELTDLISASGEIVVRIPDQCGVEVEASTTAGQIASAFDELRRESLPGRKVLRGNLGHGTGRLRLNTTSSHISLLRADESPILT